MVVGFALIVGFVLGLPFILALTFALGLLLSPLLDQERPFIEPGYLHPRGVGNRHRQTEVVRVVSSRAADYRVEMVSVTVIVDRRKLALLAGRELHRLIYYGRIFFV
jgi:hypothetical protein